LPRRGALPGRIPGRAGQSRIHPDQHRPGPPGRGRSALGARPRHQALTTLPTALASPGGPATMQIEPMLAEHAATVLAIYQAGIWTTRSGISPENAASAALHQAAGFRTVGIRERIGQQHGRWRDVVFIERRSPLI